VDLADFYDAVANRAERWHDAGFSWELRPWLATYETEKPCASVRAQAQDVIAELCIWVSGEAELQYALLPAGDVHIVQYEITNQLKLDKSLDDLESHLGK